MGIQGVKSPNTLLLLDYVHTAAGPTGCPSVQGTRGVGIQGLTLYYFLDDVQLLGLQGVQGAGGVGIQGVKSPNTRVCGG